MNKTLNQIMWASMNILIFSYIMSSMGLGSSYGPFMAITIPATAAYFGAIHSIYILLDNIIGDDGVIRYELSLPVPQSWIFLKYALENSFQAFVISSVQLPFGYVLLQGNLSLSVLAILKFYLMLLCISFFSGFFSIFVVSTVTNMYSGLDNAWMRLILPLWLFGCYNFSWQDLYAISPIMAYFSLLNPLTYALEGSRASLMFTESSLNYWHCFIALIFFTCVFGYIGIKRLMKQLDCL